MRPAKVKTVAQSPETAALRPYQAALVGLYAGTAAQALGTVALALVSRRVLDQGGIQWTGVLLALAAGLPLLSGSMSWLSGRTMDHATAALRRDTLERLLRTDTASYSRYDSGQVFSRIMQDAHTVCEWRIGTSPRTAGQALRLAAAAAALFFVNTPLALAVVFIGFAVLLGGWLFRRYLKQWHMRTRRTEERLTGFLYEILEHMEVVRSLRVCGETVRRFDRRQEDWRRKRAGLRTASTSSGTAFSTVVQLGYGILLIWGGGAIRSGRISFGDLAALLQLLGLFQGPLSGLSGIQSRLAAVHTARERLAELWTLPKEPPEQPLKTNCGLRAVVFENVTFCYAGVERPVLRDFSARISLDRWTCLTGASGSGKSTIFRLILGLYHPQRGRVYLETEQGDVPCSAAARMLFGYVPQAPRLFSGTIRENLLLSGPDADDVALWTALDQAQCGFVRELPQGLETALGEGGNGLSAGQCQRLAIARALLSGTRVLLLDESTSALDKATEEHLLAALVQAYPAAVFASHHTILPACLEAENLCLEGTA